MVRNFLSKHQRNCKRGCATILLALATLSCSKLPAEVQVIRVIDGDTVVVLEDSKEVHVRLSRIDAPEKRQAYGAKATNALKEKVLGKHLTLKNKKPDKYGRIDADIYIGDHWINEEMIQEGWAWHYRQYDKKNPAFERDEAKARKEKKGLWSDPSPLPPWLFRKQAKK